MERSKNLHHCPNSIGNCPIPHAETLIPLEKLSSLISTVFFVDVVVLELPDCQKTQPSLPVDCVELLYPKALQLLVVEFSCCRE